MIGIDHHQQHAQGAGPLHDGHAQQSVVDPRGDDRGEEHRRDHRPQVGEPANDGVVRSIAADQAGNGRAHLPHRPQYDREAQRRRGDDDEIRRRRARAAAGQYRVTEIRDAPECREQDSEPAQCTRRGVGERQQPRGTVAAREQELGEKPRHAHRDDRDQHLQNGDPPQPVSLPERKERRERGQREHGDPRKVEGEPDAQAKRARREGLRGRRRQPLAVIPQRPDRSRAAPASRPPASPPARWPASRARAVLHPDRPVWRRRRRASPATRRTHPGVRRAACAPCRRSPRPSPTCPVAPRLRRRGGAIELVEQELSHLFVGQARHELAHGFVRQRLRQRGRLRLGRMGLRTGGKHGEGRAGRREEADQRSPGTFDRTRTSCCSSESRSGGECDCNPSLRPLGRPGGRAPQPQLRGMKRSAHQLNTMSRSAAPSSSPYRSRSLHCCSRAYSTSSSVTARSLIRRGTLVKLGV